MTGPALPPARGSFAGNDVVRAGREADPATVAAARRHPDAKPQRFLFANWDGGGNTPPQRALMRELVRRGHDVHLTTHDTLAAAALADGVRFHPMPRAIPQQDPAQRIAADAQTAIFRDAAWLNTSLTRWVMGLHEALRPSATVVDCMLIDVLRTLGDAQARMVVFSHLAYASGGAAIRHMDRLAALATGWPDGTAYRRLVSRAVLNLSATYETFNRERLSSNTRYFGPIREVATGAAAPRRHPELPLILVALSSIFTGQRDTLAAIAEALGGLPVEVFLTTGRGVDPSDLPASPLMTVEAIFPHDALLPSTDLMVTHAGLGTVMYGAGAGVPSLCLPNGRDQDDNADRVVELGLGRAMTREAAPREIAEVVRDMLADARLRQTVKAFAEGVERFGDLAGAADAVVEVATSG